MNIIHFKHKRISYFTTLLLPRSNGEDDSQEDAEEGGAEDALFARKQEGDGVGRKPEERDGLLEHEFPLHFPVQVLDNLTHLNRTDETSQRTAIAQNMRVGHLVQGHEDRTEGGVHHHRYGECQQHLLPRQRSGKYAGRIVHTEIGGKGRYSIREDHESKVNPHAEESPHEGVRQDAEPLEIIFTCADAQSQQLAHRGKHGKLQKTHHHSMLGIERHIERI